jgi:sRNA-binding carbon storage regulator CsrA
MIVMSREVGSTIMIGDDVEVLVDAIDQHAIEITVTRREINGRLTSESTHRLALSEQLDLKGGCTCTLGDLRSGKARLGIVAPKTTSIHRKEVWEAIRGKMRGDK